MARPLGALELEQEDGVLAPLPNQALHHLAVDADRGRVGAAAVDHGGNLTGRPEAAVRVLAGLLAQPDGNGGFAHFELLR